MSTKPKKHHQVRYQWLQSDGKFREGRTVVTALSQSEAEAKFQRQNQHVRVVSQVAPVADATCKECGVPLGDIADCTCITGAPARNLSRPLRRTQGVH